MVINISISGSCSASGKMSGSFSIIHQGQVWIQRDEISLGPGTSNVAYFKSLMIAAGLLQELLEQNGRDPENVRVIITSCSTIFVRRMTGQTRRSVNQQQRKFAELTNQCRNFLKPFGDWRIQWKKARH